MRSMKILGGAAALITTALVGGTLIGSVFAAPSEPTTDADEAVTLLGGEGEYCEVFLATFAGELDTDEAALEAAWRNAANAAIDAAVEAGDLDADRAAAIKENLAEADLNMCRILAGRPGMVWKQMGEGARHSFVRDLTTAAAEALGMEPADVVAAFKDGTSLEELAGEQDVAYDDVKAAVLADAQTDLDAAVEEGRISQERADAVYERLESWLNEGGEPPAWGRGRGHRPFGPPSDEGNGSS
jgi:hypothetical protein